MAGKSSRSGNFAPGPPATRYNASGKNREFYTFENAPGLGNYATGGTIIDGGDGYIYHIFTGTGTFTVNRPPAAINSVDYLIVAGGGAIIPGTASLSGGGGGGGMLFGSYAVLPNTPYAITVGAGGPSVANVPTTAGTQRNGSPSEAFDGTIVATGGGSGGNATPGIDGRPGGSGGGGAFPGGTGGTGNNPTATIPRQGYPGATPSGAASGGGGAGGAGVAGGPTTPQVGAGGPGRIAPEFPSTIVRQAIPAPLLPSWEPLVGPRGYAAGGCGTDPTGVVPAPLTRSTPANSGYGGQGGGANAGGSGIVCIRYKKTVPYSRATGGIIEPSTDPSNGHPGVWRHIFTSPGTFEVTDPTLQYIDYLAVGGGGGGGGSPTIHGGGGGAGGFVSSIHTSTTTPTVIPEAYPWNPGYSVRVGEQYSVGIGTYPIGIGTGGNAATVGNDTTIGNPGASQIIAYGGGRGGGGGSPPTSSGGAGASGGGGSKPAASGSVAGGTATPTPLIQGNDGGTTPSTIPSTIGGGGGGAGAAGGATGAGGAGWYSVLSPSAYGTPGPLTPNPIYRYFAGGGGGQPTTTGGAGGGGAGSATVAGTPGTTNTGGGGGGGTNALGGTGGPGIVIIQYPE